MSLWFPFFPVFAVLPIFFILLYVTFIFFHPLIFYLSFILLCGNAKIVNHFPKLAKILCDPVQWICVQWPQYRDPVQWPMDLYRDWDTYTIFIIIMFVVMMEAIFTVVVVVVVTLTFYLSAGNQRIGGRMKLRA